MDDSSLVIKNLQKFIKKSDGVKSEAVVQRCCIKKVFFRNFAKFTGKNLCRSLFFNKVQASGLQLYLKKDPGTGVSL